MIDKVLDLNNEYYELIPRTEYAFDKLQYMTDTYSVDQEIWNITEIFDIDAALKLVYAAYYNSIKINPYDYIFSALPCSINWLDQSSEMFSLIY